MRMPRTQNYDNYIQDARGLGRAVRLSGKEAKMEKNRWKYSDLMPLFGP